MRAHFPLQQQPIPFANQNAAISLQAKQLKQQIAQTNSAMLQSGETAVDARHASLVKAANSFEATLMQELMKPLNSKDPLFAEDGSNGGSDDGGDDDGGVLASYGNESLAQALAAQGGLGIGKMVVKQVERESAGKTKTGTEAVQAVGHSGTGPTKVSKKNGVHD